ncbi:MAG: enoyl-CoA hydratase/isomerase family protein [Hyphomicrobiales bacterium]
MPDCLLEKRADGVALITLNRPDRLNSMGGDLMPLLAQHLAECEEDRSVRCVALTGAGRAFCAGGDVGNMQRRNDSQAQPPADESPTARLVTSLEAQARGLRQNQNETSLRLHTMGKPTVAIVNGHAVGAGLSLALACDIRLAGPGAKFGTAFRNVGLSGDYGGSYYLQRLVGAGKARELYFTAEILDARQALELGIANRVYEGDDWFDQALAFCTKLAAGPTATYGRMKANLNLAETAGLQAVLDQEALNMRLSGMSRDSREAVQAFMEKREPRFVGE